MSTLLSIAFATAVNGTAYDVTAYERTPHGSDALDASNPYVVATDEVEISGGLLTVKDGNDANWSLAGVSFGSFGNQVGGAWDATQGCASVVYTFTTGALDDVSIGPLMFVQKDELGVASPYPLQLVLEDNGDDTWTLHLEAQGFDAPIDDDSIIFGRTDLEGIETNVRVEWQTGTVVGDFSDVTADGFIRVYWNGTLILDLTSLDLYISDDQAGPNYANGFSIGYSGLMGTVSSVRVADSLCSNSSRNLLVGSTHEVTGDDNVIAGTLGTIVGDRNVLANLDGTPRTRTRSGAFHIYGDFYLNDTPASKLLGRGSSDGAGKVDEITLGTNLSMTGTTLNAGSGSGGDSSHTAAYASRPASDNAGDLFLPTDGFYLERDAAGSPGSWAPWGPIFPFTAPISGDFSWVNQGSSSVVTTFGGVALVGAATGIGANIVARVKSAPTPPYVITAVLHANLFAKAFQSVGLCFRQSSDGKLHVFHMIFGSAFAMVSVKYTSPTAFSADYTNVNVLPDRLLFLRIADNNTNRICSVSGDGQNWVTFHTVTRTDFLTANQVGFCVSTENSATPNFAPILTLLSWKET
jgi:hypothetical protein